MSTLTMASWRMSTLCIVIACGYLALSEYCCPFTCASNHFLLLTNVPVSFQTTDTCVVLCNCQYTPCCFAISSHVCRVQSSMPLSRR
ncbi:hypothetical protein C8F01DRAFT_1171021 [Mycena amicta]|nr:hypothetical protein C8F01DRAFT_1171021 [Mycena amicta]